MKTLLVTGPIGSGKSEVCRYLEACGYPVYDCDSRTKRLYDSVPGLKSSIEEALGISWEEIGIIFSDSARRKKLESMVYPLVVEDILQWKAGLDTELAFIESAIALDKREFDGLYDGVVLVTAEYEVRCRRDPRAAARDRLQSHDAGRIDHIIDNSTTIEDLHRKTDKLLCKLI